MQWHMPSGHLVIMGLGYSAMAAIRASVVVWRVASSVEECTCELLAPAFHLAGTGMSRLGVAITFFLLRGNAVGCALCISTHPMEKRGLEEINETHRQQQHHTSHVKNSRKPNNKKHHTQYEDTLTRRAYP